MWLVQNEIIGTMVLIYTGPSQHLCGQGASSSYTEHSTELVRPRPSPQSLLLGYHAQPQARLDGWKGLQTNVAS